jgi:DNA-binding beta-propeller fold protein YncE
MRKEIIILNTLLITLLGCSISTNNNEVKPTINPSSSVEVSTIPTYSPTPLPVIEDKSLDPNYSCGNTYFKDLNEQTKNPKILKPYDLAVSNDGSKVYVTKYSYISECENNTSKSFIDRSFIYKIENNKVEILKLDNSYDYSKTLESLIEIDKDNNLYVIQTDINKKLDYYGNIDILNKQILKIHNDTIYEKITLKKEDFTKYNYDTYYLYVSKIDTSITYSVHPYKVEKDKIINKINKDNSIDPLYVYSLYGNVGIHSSIFENNILSFGSYDVKEPFPYIYKSLINDTQIINKLRSFPKITHSIRQLKINSKKELFAIADNIIYNPDGSFKEIKRENRIYKIVPDKGFEVFAGSEEAGYRDGLGGTAMFNNPLNIDFDANDNMYVADTGNNAIRKITPNGDVTTFFKQD